MARKVGEIVGRGRQTWLVRAYNGHDLETKKRKYLNQTIQELRGLRQAVVPTGAPVSEKMCVDEAITEPGDLGPLNDLLITTVHCADLAGLCPSEFRYQPPTGLSFSPREADSS